MIEAIGFRTVRYTVELLPTQLIKIAKEMEIGDTVMGGLMIDSEPPNIEPQEIPNAVPNQIEEDEPSKMNLKKLISPFRHS
jgi:hypothetical protein